jgi:hypothetical protein
MNNSPSKFGLIATTDIIAEYPAEYPSKGSTQYLQSFGQNMYTSKQSFNKNNFSYIQNQELFTHEQIFVPTVKIGAPQYT